jgi:cysteinyl-tRNA synthetase
MMQFHNSLSRAVEVFTPVDPEHVRMYVCGPTVYSTPHVGNARPAVVFDTLLRVLRDAYPRVSYARNITDIDDKIINIAFERGETITEVTSRTVAEYHEIVDLLGCLRPDHEPRATWSIAAMQTMIAALITNGHAYVAEDHVLFDIASYPQHGLLSRHLQADLGAEHSRITAPASYKRSQDDFVLWKPSAADQPGWASPWGIGRPGWHIECSAMIEDIFPDVTIDIHGGGGDLRFPHHDCEISQSACAHGGRPLANLWMHNGMVLLDGKKMAKSTGNILHVRDLLDRGFTGPEIRLTLLSAHYRQPLDLKNQLEIARKAIQRWSTALDGDTSEVVPPAPDNAIVQALRDDLNTPLAISAAHELTSRINATISLNEKLKLKQQLRAGLTLLGIPSFDGNTKRLLTTEQLGIFTERLRARAEKDYARSDQLRDELRSLGIEVRDTKDGTDWWAISV